MGARGPFRVRSASRALLTLIALSSALQSPALAEERPSAPAAPPSIRTKAPPRLALDALDQVGNRLVASRAIPGGAVAVAHRGKIVYQRAYGTWKDDTLVRIYSMTKPITVVAALTLVDAGKLGLDDPVAKYLPAFANMRVHGSEVAPPPMTVRQLMQHTSGLTYGYFGLSAVDRMMRTAGIIDNDQPLAVLSNRLAKLPLLYVPGTRWNYSVSTDLLGRIIEVVSGHALDVFFKQRLFVPLGMVDTDFYVPEAKLHRFVPCCGPLSLVIESVAKSRFRTKPQLLSGGGGLISTLSDYMRFALMLDAGGTWQGKRLLKPETVRLMHTNQLAPDLLPLRIGPITLADKGFGLGVSVRLKASAPDKRVGSWGWSGAASTTFMISPKDRIVLVTMAQRMPLWHGLHDAATPVIFGAVDRAAKEGVPHPASKRAESVGSSSPQR